MVQNEALDIESYRKLIKNNLRTGEFNKANEYCYKILDLYPDETETLFLKLCAEVGVRERIRLGESKNRFVDRYTYKRLLRMASDLEKTELDNYDKQIIERIENEKIEDNNRRRKKVISTIIVIGVCAFIFEVVLLGDAFISLKKVDKYLNTGDYKSAKDAVRAVKFFNTDNLSDYIDAYILYEEKEYKQAKEKFAKLDGYKDSNMQELLCDYYIALDQDDIAKANEVIDALKSVELRDNSIDQEEMEKQLDNKKRELIFHELYLEGKYRDCKTVLNEWDNVDSEEKKVFVNEHENIWYDNAISMINNKDDDIETKIASAEEQLKLCDADYSDVQSYLDIYNAFHNNDIDSLFAYVEEYPLAEQLLFMNDLPTQWLVGKWKSSDGKCYFDCDYDGQYFSSSFNLPCDWRESGDTHSYVDSDGVYYIFDSWDTSTPPESRRAAFKINIRAKDDIQMFCYKGNVNWRIEK